MAGSTTSPQVRSAATTTSWKTSFPSRTATRNCCTRRTSRQPAATSPETRPVLGKVVVKGTEKHMIKLDTSNLRGDIFGGITAGVVALPLALAMGVASGLGPIAGMYGAIFVGF